MDNLMHIKNQLPTELLMNPPNLAYQMIDDLSVFHLKGEFNEPLVISTLLHGNETSGFEALRLLMCKYENKPLPRDIILVFGNIQAARLGIRQLKGQVDFNRIWDQGESDEHLKTRKILQYLQTQNLFAAIDLHNTSGKNPYYVAIDQLSHRTIALAQFISDRIVYFKEPHSVFSAALAEFCPSITFEAGLSGNLEIINYIAGFLDEILNMKSLPQISAHKKQVQILHSYGRICIPENTEFVFGENSACLSIDKNLDRHNFELVHPGTVFAQNARDIQFIVLDENSQNIASSYFKNENGILTTTQEFIPSLITTHPEIAKDDVLGYIMKSEVLDFRD